MPSKNEIVNQVNKMKTLAIIFLVGTGLLIVMGYNMVTPGSTGDRITWLTSGPPITALLCLGAAAALFLVDRKQRKK